MHGLNNAFVEVTAQIQAIAHSVRKAEHVCIDGISLSIIHCVQLAHALSKALATTHLVLRHNTLTPSGLHVLANALQQNTSLYHLSLIDNAVDGQGVLWLMRSIGAAASSSSLKELHISNALAMKMPPWPRRLNAPLYQCLVQSCPSLTKLTLSNCGLHDPDIAVLIAGLAWSCQVKHVNISHNAMTDHIVPIFEYRLLVRARTLQTLDLVRQTTPRTMCPPFQQHRRT
jgi:hypothetical protein